MKFKLRILLVIAVLAVFAVMIQLMPSNTGIVQSAMVPTAGMKNIIPELKFKADGTFKILAISDVHYNEKGNPDTDELIKMLIDTEKPDFIVVNGDCISGNISKINGLRKTISYLTDILVEKKVPWAVTFGNHDPESSDKCKITKADMMSFYEACPYNMNAGWKTGISGTGNKNILVVGSSGKKPVFDIWLLDSQSDAKEPDAKYEWIKDDQVDWYVETSKALESTHGKKVPGLMFFHIPLVEIRQMVASSKVVGTRHEPECPSNVESKLLPAIIERGDVLGVFHGHDHQNNYYGKFKGVYMGYDGVAGYNPYPKIPVGDPANMHIRGGRVFLIEESNPAVFKTWMRFEGGGKSWETDAYIEYNKL